LRPLLATILLPKMIASCDFRHWRIIGCGLFSGKPHLNLRVMEPDRFQMSRFGDNSSRCFSAADAISSSTEESWSWKLAANFTVYSSAALVAVCPPVRRASVKATTTATPWKRRPVEDLFLSSE
jgi:hypothetical protein